MSADGIKAFLHSPFFENTLLILTSTISILTFSFLEAILADRLAAHCCNHPAYSPLSDRSTVGRDLEAHLRKIQFREEIGHRIEAYVGFLWRGGRDKKRDVSLVDLPIFGVAERERLLEDEDVLVIGE